MRSRGSERRVCSRLPANSMPLVRTVVGAAAAQAIELAYIGQQEWLPSRYEDFGDVQVHSLGCDAAHSVKTKCPPRGLRRRSHAAVIAVQVAVEIGVEPQARTNGRSTSAALGAAPHRTNQRVWLAPTMVLIKLFPVKRHQISRSLPSPALALVTATRSPGRQRFKAAMAPAADQKQRSCYQHRSQHSLAFACSF